MTFTISDFYCTCCGNRVYPIQRKHSRQREGGHLKKLWCPYCKEEKNCVEIKEFDSYTLEDFRTEFESGKFKDGNRI